MENAVNLPYRATRAVLFAQKARQQAVEVVRTHLSQPWQPVASSCSIEGAYYTTLWPSKPTETPHASEFFTFS